MKILSLNIRGFGVKGKFGWVKGICYSEKPDVAVFQETKCRCLSNNWVHSLWGNDNCGFVQREAIGNSGGLLVVWDTSRFIVEGAVTNEFFIAIEGKWGGSDHDSIIVNVYGPHNDKKKKKMWGALDELLNSVDSAWVVCGDFNEVKCHSDRLNCTFHHARASRFNDFILKNKLFEISINGRRFTCISDDGTKFSKLDRFLVNDKFINLWVDLSVVPIDRRESDHCPILLRDRVIDFGLKPFKVFDEWFNKVGVDKIILDAWELGVHGSRRDCNFRDKLKNVKK
ncbi:uncharacterized protein [Rutidosis leptorrhynchoides]|uniref:uncharacterized protein n=1 Tax=Rutidosis leptorrhynchoides TaxID=125765 RepID=UPI003A98FEE6